MPFLQHSELAVKKHLHWGAVLVSFEIFVAHRPTMRALRRATPEFALGQANALLAILAAYAGTVTEKKLRTSS